MKVMLAAGAASLALAAGATTPAARADAVGCTPAPYGDVCIFVWGSGLYVSHVQVVRNKIDYSLICDYQGRMTVRNGDGVLLDSRWSRRHSGCTPLKAWFDWYPRRTYPNQSKLCTAFFERGVRQGKACETIHS